MAPKKFQVDGEWKEIPSTMENIAEAHKIAKALYAEEVGHTFPGTLKIDHTYRLERPEEMVDVSDIMAAFDDSLKRVDAEVEGESEVTKRKLVPPDPRRL